MEYAPLVLEPASDRVVVRIEPNLVLVARDQDGASQHDEGPQRRNVIVGQCRDFVEGKDRGHYRERLVLLMVQDRGAGRGEITDEVAAGEITEVDDAVGSDPPDVVDLTHDIVIRDITVDRLHAK